MAAPAFGSPVQSVVALRPVRLGSGVSRCWLGSSARPTLLRHYPHQCACYADCVTHSYVKFIHFVLLIKKPVRACNLKILICL